MISHIPASDILDIPLEIPKDSLASEIEEWKKTIESLKQFRENREALKLRNQMSWILGLVRQNKLITTVEWLRKTRGIAQNLLSEF